jgi:quercetin dioxygenase-like cupin family protein
MINVGIARNPLGEIAMLAFLKRRRSFLSGAASVGIAQTLLGSEVEAQTEAQGYVLGAAEGEHLVHYRNPGNIFIKVDPVKGSKNVACGTQQVPVGAGIPIHRHFDADEAFYILDGSGTFTLNDVPHPFEKGATIFIPKNSWRVREPGQRAAAALDRHAHRPGCVLPRDLQSARRAAKAAEPRAGQPDRSQIWNRV